MSEKARQAAQEARQQTPEARLAEIRDTCAEWSAHSAYAAEYEATRDLLAMRDAAREQVAALRLSDEARAECRELRARLGRGDGG